MKIIHRLSLLAISLLLTACATKPNYDYDTNYDFNQLKQFSTFTPENTTDPLTAKRVETAITAVLVTKGFAETQENPQFKVAYAFKVEDKPKNSGVSIGLGTGSWGSSGGVSLGTSVSVPVGSNTAKIQTIQINIIDTSNNRLIWRGSDKFNFDNGGDEKAEETQKTVATILALFPPQK
ncbi:DUF4136 domain-containing protein [Shewanella colwelliana]|uniref:DUF4136 domain-containing protein n=1 Tax=Shewanella colwelliana TaxID=23 RepID=UPI00299CD681|nr:DUF4136 domain-containing protein [Shewanella colwelliana]MDX1279781.1 DUF4136 domain-containing protein [Shewanella colwelliana]